MLNMGFEEMLWAFVPSNQDPFIPREIQGLGPQSRPTESKTPKGRAQQPELASPISNSHACSNLITRS